MKKAYVKIKPKTVKKSFKNVYIIAAMISAALCATVFSFLLKSGEELANDVKIEVTDVTPTEIAQVSEPLEIEVPITEEIETEKNIEVVEPPAKAEETSSVTTNELKFSMPVSGKITNNYSGQKPVKSKTTGDWRVHSGIDITAPTGTDVKAPFEGKITLAENNKLTGHTVTIDHGNGFVTTIYNLESISVEQGTSVKSGDKIGTVGTSATLEASDEPHVHFEIKKDGKTVNPVDYIK